MASIELLEDACERLPHTTRKMFGGHGLFAPNGGMFAGIVDDDRIILKLAGEKARDELCALGTEAWTYPGKTGGMTMREWILVPDAFYDDPEQLAAWAARAHKLAPAKGEKKAKPKSPKVASGKRPAVKAAAKKAARGGTGKGKGKRA